MLEINPRFRPPFDPDFLPAALWNRAYQSLVAKDRAARPFALVLERPDGSVSRYDGSVLGSTHPRAELTFLYAERLLKFLLWQRGGCKILVAGADEIAASLAKLYRDEGERAFDARFMGEQVYRRPFIVEPASLAKLPVESPNESCSLGRQLKGCRIGFDLGGSDRKVAALIDGRVVFSEEVAWDPYFQQDPAYHLAGVHDSLLRAAAYLPRIDAIGGSAAGIYIDNEVRVASLFRGVPAELFARHIRRMFFTLQERWGGVPFEVVNDGEVTALAGSMAISDNAVLGISMGTSLAGGYITVNGGITPWLNELAFTPVDYRPDAPRDEWSGDVGCGVKYFSQQGVARLAVVGGFGFRDDMPLPDRLVAVQQAMANGDPRAGQIYESIGIAFGYAVAHYADHYDLRHVLVLGRVTTGLGGEIIVARATEVLKTEFPAYAGIRLHLPGEEAKRHGQAIAAASLPVLSGSV